MYMPMLYVQNILIPLQKLYGRQNGSRQHYATLLGSTASYSERKLECTFEIHANLLAYIGKLTAV